MGSIKERPEWLQASQSAAMCRQEDMSTFISPRPSHQPRTVDDCGGKEAERGGRGGVGEGAEGGGGDAEKSTVPSTRHMTRNSDSEVGLQQFLCYIT